MVVVVGGCGCGCGWWGAWCWWGVAQSAASVSTLAHVGIDHVREAHSSPFIIIALWCSRNPLFELRAMAFADALPKRTRAGSFDEDDSFAWVPLEPPSARHGDGHEETKANGKGDAAAEGLARSAPQSTLAHV